MEIKTVLKLMLFHLPIPISFVLGLVCRDIFLLLLPLIQIVIGFFSMIVLGKMLLKIYSSRMESNKVLEKLVDEVRSIFDVKSRILAAVMRERCANIFTIPIGLNKYIIVATDRLLEILDRDELKAVIGHEIAHIRNRDSLLKSYLYVERFIQIPFGIILYAAFSRNREFKADETSALTLGNPLNLASALIKICRENMSVGRLKFVSSMLILPQSRFLSKILSTHPPLEQRIRNLVMISERLENNIYS